MIVLAVMAALAKAERPRISERTKVGLQRVRARGTRLGRPALADKVRQQIAALAAEGLSSYAISKMLTIDIKTAQR